MNSTGFCITGTKAVINNSNKQTPKKEPRKSINNEPPSTTAQKPNKIHQTLATKEVTALVSEKKQPPSSAKEEVSTKQCETSQIEEEKVIVEPVVPSEPTELPQPAIKKVTIRYSHYKDSFQALGNTLLFATIDNKYCISFVFKGNFIPKLKSNKTQDLVAQHNGSFLVEDDDYTLEIQEDEEEESKYEHRAYIAPQLDALINKNHRVQLLTKQLKSLSLSQITDKTPKYSQLLQQRDLEDILYK